MKVCLIAAPLEARSGVYRSVQDLVTEARSRGLDWTAIIGLRPTAAHSGESAVDGIREVYIHKHGRAVLDEIADLVVSSREVVEADAVVTLISQSDIALARSMSRLNGFWVSYVRGLPWPAVGEQNPARRAIQKYLETRALRSARDVWATTDVLATEVSRARTPHIVPAGIPSMPRISHGESRADEQIVWAGRLSGDKQPGLFTDIMRSTGIAGTIFGAGPMQEQVTAAAPDNVIVRGWVNHRELWRDAAVFVGTSSREAFGRSAAEAALSGVPVILGTEYGVAPLLYKDEELRRQFVLPARDAALWRRSLMTLVAEPELRRRVSDHVHQNALELTISRSVDRMKERLTEIA